MTTTTHPGGEPAPSPARLALAESIERLSAVEHGTEEVFVTNYVVLAECIDSSGKRNLHTMTGDPLGRGIAPWTAEGMLMRALRRMHA